jgi:hypothetical protein
MVETHDGLAQVGRSSFESTQVAVAKNAVEFSAKWLLKRLRKTMLKQGRVLT